ncbi:MAG TPA: peptidoglycan-binding protein [Candidatus Paceibacterota bacterium]|nr:peptidoglycan-binding protein [Candidatus Paceibacterota bacterium]
MSKRLFCAIAFFSLVFLFLVPLAKADYTGQQNSFFIDSSYDLTSRNKVNATLLLITSRLYFYVDNQWWSGLTYSDRDNVNRNLYYLSHRFEDEDYLVLTKTFGSEAKPGLDNDEHITVLIHSLPENVSGYTRSVDLVEKTKDNTSNQREMVYLAGDAIINTSASRIGYILAHEFTHLITLNQKGALATNDDDVWLNEGRAEYAATLLGYDSAYSGSNLEHRVNDFWRNPSVSLVDWQPDSYHYAAVNLFTQYLVDHYGVKVLVDSLHSKLTGAASLNEALKQNGFAENFNQIFQDWTLAVLLNDCKVGPKYCYKNTELQSLRIYPYGYYLPDNGASNLSVSNNLLNWSGNWLKIVGGKDNLEFDFNFPANTKFSMPYVIVDQAGNKTVKFWSDSAGYSGTIVVPSFNQANAALFFLPTVTEDKSADSYLFKWEASTITEAERQQIEAAAEQKMIIFLTSRINQLKAIVASLMTQLANLNRGQSLTCGAFLSDLYSGLKDNGEVKCLQKFLINQGLEIYPEGLVTGNYLSATEAAVRRFQAKNGLPQTGYFGPLTRILASKLASF